MNETERHELWTAEGLLWQNITLYGQGTRLIGTLKNARNFMSDREILFEENLGIQKAIDLLMNEDADFYDQLTMYAEEG